MVMQQQSELPEGWIKTNFSDCVDILDNRRIPVNSKEREKRTGNIPYYGATGDLLLNGRNRIERHLVCARFKDGEALLVEMAEENDAEIPAQDVFPVNAL